MPDRIAAVTYMCCAAVTGGELILSGADIGHIGAVVPVFKEMGCRVYSFGKDSIYIKAPERLKAPHTIRTMPYPYFRQTHRRRLWLYALWRTELRCLWKIYSITAIVM